MWQKYDKKALFIEPLIEQCLILALRNHFLMAILKPET